MVGEAIPLAGRIVAIADVFDALTQKRPYKAAWPVADAVAEIERQRGRQFDPAIVDAFLRVIEPLARRPPDLVRGCARVTTHRWTIARTQISDWLRARVTAAGAAAWSSASAAGSIPPSSPGCARWRRPDRSSASSCRATAIRRTRRTRGSSPTTSACRRSASTSRRRTTGCIDEHARGDARRSRRSNGSPVPSDGGRTQRSRCRSATSSRGCAWRRCTTSPTRSNYLVAGTGNRSELTIGYFTKHGDGGVDLLPLGSLLKSEVRALAIELGVPRAIIDKAPSAGLVAGQTDEAEMGFAYGDLERYLIRGPEGVPPALALRIERLIRASEHKRGMAPTPE